MNEEAKAEFKKKVTEKGDAEAKRSLHDMQKQVGHAAKSISFLHKKYEKTCRRQECRRSEAP